jgi:hypothetical protein
LRVASTAANCWPASARVAKVTVGASQQTRRGDHRRDDEDEGVVEDQIGRAEGHNIDLEDRTHDEHDTERRPVVETRDVHRCPRRQDDESQAAGQPQPATHRQRFQELLVGVIRVVR